jgi:pimeloyl-ACP methyl ester carboxylesterase
MRKLAKIRAAAEYAARHARAEPARVRAAVLLDQISVSEAATTGGGGRVPTIAARMLLGSLVLSVGDLVGRAWLKARADDPDVAAFAAMQATARPPSPARIDEICSRVLWARFARQASARTARPARGLRSRCMLDTSSGRMSIRHRLRRAR